MNKLSIFTLKALRKVYLTVFPLDNSLQAFDDDPDSVSDILYKTLIDDKPCMIARFGANELSCMVNYQGTQSPHNIIKYTTGKQPAWWWNKSLANKMILGAGFFPATPVNLAHFSQMMIDDLQSVDILGSWLSDEKIFSEQLAGAKKVQRILLNPFFAKTPWTRVLAGRKVLVIHPFADSIRNQYEKRQLLFVNGVLPDFELKIIKAVQSLANEKTQYKDWFEALDVMKKQIDVEDFDICLIGCGAYGFPLAAHVKRMGKKAVHLGGDLQILFGIKGGRWMRDSYNPKYNFVKLVNEHWVSPLEHEIPKEAKKVENGAYW